VARPCRAIVRTDGGSVDPAFSPNKPCANDGELKKKNEDNKKKVRWRTKRSRTQPLRKDTSTGKKKENPQRQKNGESHGKREVGRENKVAWSTP